METNKHSSEEIELLLRKLQSKLSPLEETVFQTWLDKDVKNADLFADLQNEEKLKKKISFFSSINIDTNWDLLVSKANVKDMKVRWWQSNEVLKYAAVFLIFLIVSVIFYRFQALSTDNLENDKVVRNYDVEPGKDKAILTLSDGTKLSLDEATDGVLREHKGVKIIKKGDKVIYQFSKSIDANKVISYNTITTPRGGKYQLILPDGSQVWLNSASSLSFPTIFSGAERVVELKGEGYFEVAKNKKQRFKVKTNETTIEVLGTHFNVNAYSSEGLTRTSLLEGSVKVSNSKSQTIIKPGEQAIVDITSEIKTVQADLEEVIAWKDGYFQFNDESFSSIVAQLERWYDVEFIYPASLASVKFAGAIPRNSNLSQVLNMLELSGSLKFKIEERRIKVIR